MSTKLLAIEDNEQSLYLITFLFEKKGYEVVTARDGREGIEMAGRHEPALILLDIQLPGMDGYTVAQELRRNSDLADVPIIAVTSYALVGDRERCLEAGCTGYICKPIDPDTFVAEIEAHLPPELREGRREP